MAVFELGNKLVTTEISTGGAGIDGHRATRTASIREPHLDNIGVFRIEIQLRPPCDPA